MGDLVSNVPISEITATCESLDRAGISRFGLKRARSDRNLAKQLAWIMHQVPDTDFRIEVPKTPLIELAEDLAMDSSHRALIRRMSEAESPLTMPNRHLALLDYGPEVDIQEASTALTNLARRRTGPYIRDTSFLEASLRDLLLLEQQHREEIEQYDICLPYVPFDEGDCRSFRFLLFTEKLTNQRSLYVLKATTQSDSTLFLARKS
jgi:hypothetical protein